MPFLSRKEPFYALCGLNCCLCPRFNTEGRSKCPGCGGPGFTEKHPSCAVMGCSIKHGSIEFCYQCSDYPCKKYEKQSEKDSFASYANVIENFSSAKKDLRKYIKELKNKYSYLQLLIEKYNDGKSKTFYCVIVNNMPYNDLSDFMNSIETDRALNTMENKDRAKEVVKLFKNRAEELGIAYKLRK